MEYIINIINEVSSITKIITKTIINTIIDTTKHTSVIQTLFFIDGLICSSVFLKEFLLLKISEKRSKLNSKFIFDYQKEIIKKYSSIYILDTIDRSILYICLYIFSLVLDEFEFKHNYFFIIFVIPYIQNFIIKLTPYTIYLKNKEIFIKYSISKISINFIQNLHKDINPISNYHIFIIYNLISFDFIWTMLNNFLLISLLYFLKTNEKYYYYYKAIKLSYFYNSGYQFTIISLYDSIYLANLIIKEKRWNEFSKMEVVNTFYVLVTSKYNEPNSSIKVSILILLYKFFSLWSIISLIKFTCNLNNIYINVFLITITSFILPITTTIIIWCLISFNINDIIITLVLICNEQLYIFLKEIYFFTRNIYSIKKVLKTYQGPELTKQEKLENQFVFI